MFPRTTFRETMFRRSRVLIWVEWQRNFNRVTQFLRDTPVVNAWCSKGKWFECQREHICPDWKHLEFFSGFSSNRQTYHLWESNLLYFSWFQTFSLFWMFYAFLRVIPRRLNFICRRFGTLCLFHLHRRVGMRDNLGWEFWGIFLINTQTFSCLVILYTYLPMKMEQSVPKRRYTKFRRRGITLF
jgi:hypothetical protein